MRYGVITQVPSPEDGGNLALAMDLYVETEQPSDLNGYKGEVTFMMDFLRNGGVDPIVMLSFRETVFQLGEILLLDDSGREFGAPGRKPSKWDVTCEEFATAEEAINRAQEVLAQ